MRIAAPRTIREGIVALGLAILVGVGGCTLGSPPHAPAPATRASDLSHEVLAVLNARATAILAGSREEFLLGLGGDPAFVAAQVQYFENLQLLPLGVLAYELPAERDPVAADGAIAVDVTVSLQLAGYDATPVRSPAHYTFTRDGAGGWVLTGTQDVAWERNHGVVAPPWERFEIRTLERSGVLGIFDTTSWSRARELVDSVVRGAREVRPELPFAWDPSVVVYAFSTTEVLADLPDLPGGDPARVDAVAFPVGAAPGSDVTASTRFIIHPRMLARDGTLRDRLVRHELVHVAMGERDNRVPVWLSEGVAEYISVQAIPEHERLISRATLDAARDGLDSLPEDETFNGSRSGRNYGVAWYACAYIADTYGEATLWRLFDEMRADGGTRQADQDEVLKRVLGIDSQELARAAGKRIVATFG